MPTYKILFVGLGKMGFHMAGYLSKNQNVKLFIFNRTKSVEHKWKKKFIAESYNFKNDIKFDFIISSYTEKLRSRSIGYDVIEAIEGERSFLTVYGSKIWDLFPAMSFLKLLNFETNLPNMEFDYSKLEKKIIFYANL